MFCICLLGSVVECRIRKGGVVVLCYACMMCMEKGKKIFVDSYAWSVLDTETAATVGSGKVELEVGLGWIFGRQVFFRCSFALFVHAVDPDDGSSSRCELSQQTWERVFEWFCRNSYWTKEILLEIDEEERSHPD